MLEQVACSNNRSKVVKCDVCADVLPRRIVHHIMHNVVIIDVFCVACQHARYLGQPSHLFQPRNEGNWRITFDGILLVTSTHRL